MIVACENCRTKFRLADDRVSPQGVKVRCSRCSHVFIVTSEGAAPGLPRPDLPSLIPPALAPSPQDFFRQLEGRPPVNDLTLEGGSTPDATWQHWMAPPTGQFSGLPGTGQVGPPPPLTGQFSGLPGTGQVGAPPPLTGQFSGLPGTGQVGAPPLTGQFSESSGAREENFLERGRRAPEEFSGLPGTGQVPLPPLGPYPGQAPPLGYEPSRAPNDFGRPPGSGPFPAPFGAGGGLPAFAVPRPANPDRTLLDPLLGGLDLGAPPPSGSAAAPFGGFGSSVPPPPTGFAPASTGQFGQPPISSQFGKPPISSQFGKPPISSPFGQPPVGSQFGQPPVSSQFGQPPISSQFGQPPISSQFGQPPISSQFGKPPLSGPFPEPSPPDAGSAASALAGLFPPSNDPGPPRPPPARAEPFPEPPPRAPAVDPFASFGRSEPPPPRYGGSDLRRALEGPSGATGGVALGPDDLRTEVDPSSSPDATLLDQHEAVTAQAQVSKLPSFSPPNASEEMFFPPPENEGSEPISVGDAPMGGSLTPPPYEGASPPRAESFDPSRPLGGSLAPGDDDVGGRSNDLVATPMAAQLLARMPLKKLRADAERGSEPTTRSAVEGHLDLATHVAQVAELARQRAESEARRSVWIPRLLVGLLVLLIGAAALTALTGGDRRRIEPALLALLGREDPSVDEGIAGLRAEDLQAVYYPVKKGELLVVVGRARNITQAPLGGIEVVARISEAGRTVTEQGAWLGVELPPRAIERVADARDLAARVREATIRLARSPDAVEVQPGQTFDFTIVFPVGTEDLTGRYVGLYFRKGLLN